MITAIKNLILKFKTRQKIETENIRLHQELAAEKETVTILKEELTVIKEEIVATTENSGFEVDFEKLNAFSIERNINSVISDNGDSHDDYLFKAQTVIGYLSKDGLIKEWWFNCSDNTHSRLCDEFKAYRAKHEDD